MDRLQVPVQICLAAKGGGARPPVAAVPNRATGGRWTISNVGRGRRACIQQIGVKLDVHVGRNHATTRLIGIEMAGIAGTGGVSEDEYEGLQVHVGEGADIIG